MQNVKLLVRGIARLRRLRWWLFASVIVLLVLVQDEWSAIAGSVGFAGFWVPWLADLIRDWTPSTRHARAASPSERERIEDARQDIMRRRAEDVSDEQSRPS